MTGSGRRKGEYPVPAGAQTHACPHCGADIVLRKTASGAWQPLSAATVVERYGYRFALAHYRDCTPAQQLRARRGPRRR